MRQFKDNTLNERFCKSKPNSRRPTRNFQRSGSATTSTKFKPENVAFRFVGIVSAIWAVSAFCNAAVWAQQSTAAMKTTGERTRADAQSILNSTQPNGRVGGTRVRGAFSPTPGENSRFQSGALYGTAGNVVGVDRNSPNSAFQSSESRRFKTKKDFDLIALRNDLYRLRAAAQAENSTGTTGANDFNPNAPRAVVANAPRPFPKAGGRTAQYGKTAEEIAAEEARRAAFAQADAARNVAVPAESASESNAAQAASAAAGRAPETIWMRGRAPIGGDSSVPTSDFNRFDDYRDFSGFGSAGNWGVLNGGAGDDYSVGSRWVELDGRVGNFGADGTVRSEFSGATGQANAPAASPLPGFAPTPEQTQAAFREYLEALLLRSPDVNALSPIRVDFVDGVATVRGIVPTPAAREIAGRILLTDPRVQRVDNRLTFVRNDVDSNGIGAPSPVSPTENANGSNINILPDVGNGTNANSGWSSASDGASGNATRAIPAVPNGGAVFNAPQTAPSAASESVSPPARLPGLAPLN